MRDGRSDGFAERGKCGAVSFSGTEMRVAVVVVLASYMSLDGFATASSLYIYLHDTLPFI
jgi:hypothetical protein